MTLAMLNPLGPAHATPTPPPNPTDGQITAAQSAKDALADRVGQLGAAIVSAQTQLQTLQGKEEAAEQQVAYALSLLQGAKQSAGRARQRVQAAQRQVADAHLLFVEYLQASYASGNVTGLAGSVMTAKDPAALLDRSALADYQAQTHLDAISGLQRASVLKSNADAAARVAVSRQAQAAAAAAKAERAARAAFAAEQAQAATLRATMANSQSELDAAQEQLATLNNQRAAYLAYKAEQARLARLAAIRAAKLRAERIAAAKRAAAARAAAEARAAAQARAEAHARALAQAREEARERAARAAASRPHDRDGNDSGGSSTTSKRSSGSAEPTTSDQSSGSSHSPSSGSGSNLGSSGGSSGSSGDGSGSSGDGSGSSGGNDGAPSAPSYGSWTAAKGREAVARAMNELGLPYAWAGGGVGGPSYGVCDGGAGAPNDCNVRGFDCSGLALFAWGHYWAHKASIQYSEAGSYHPSMDDLRPGDLVFWSYGGESDIHHVAIYKGGGEIIEAPYSGGYIQISSLYAYGQPYGATRPLT